MQSFMLVNLLIKLNFQLQNARPLKDLLTDFMKSLYSLLFIQLLVPNENL